MQKKYYKEILRIIQSSDANVASKLENFHASDIADVLEGLRKEDRLKLYSILPIDFVSEIVSFYDDPEKYILEMDEHFRAKVFEEMDSDDAIDVLDELSEDEKDSIISLMATDQKEALKKLDMYDDDTIGSEMSDNYIAIKESNTIKSATAEVIKQAGEHDNIYNVYVIKDDNTYVGAIDLRDLIVARKDSDFKSLIKTSFPTIYDDELVSDCIGRIKEYAEGSLPILDRANHLIGAITGENVISVAQEEMEEDYVKLGGLTQNEDFNESTLKSVCKRLPWLIILLFLGFIVSSVIGAFEVVIATLPIIVFFQSMILDMSGNVGTQSLAVTIRNITDEGFKEDKKRQRKSILKELRIGLLNGLIIGLVAFIFVLAYLVILHKEVRPGDGYLIRDCLLVSGIIGGSMLLSISLSSIIGTSFPLLLNKLHIDPAVASGPFITTINDVIAVIVYYGLTFILLVNVI